MSSIRTGHHALLAMLLAFCAALFLGCGGGSKEEEKKTNVLPVDVPSLPPENENVITIKITRGVGDAASSHPVYVNGVKIGETAPTPLFDDSKTTVFRITPNADGRYEMYIQSLSIFGDFTTNVVRFEAFGGGSVEASYMRGTPVGEKYEPEKSRPLRVDVVNKGKQKNK